MGTARYALLFEPGTYGSQKNPLSIPVGYYTEVDGLGQDPSAVAINGRRVYCHPQERQRLALDNFWRSVSNLTIHVVATADGCPPATRCGRPRRPPRCAGSISRASPLSCRYCDRNPQYASGGFVADSRLDGGRSTARSSSSTCATATWSAAGPTTSGTRSSRASPARPRRLRQRPAYTTLPTTPVSREKPYLYIDARAPRTCSCRPPGPTRPAPPGRTATTPAPRSRCRTSSSPSRPTRSHDQRRRSPGATTCCSRPASTTSRVDQDQPRRHGRARPGHGHLTAVNGAVPITR